MNFAPRVVIIALMCHRDQRTREAVTEVYREESRRVLATLVRLLGDFDLAEDALHMAFAAALERWPGEGIPGNPRAWLISTGRFKAIDRLRKHARVDAGLEALLSLENDRSAESGPGAEEHLEDDRLRLIFVCCHPALTAEARTALTLREVCGLTTEEIARAFLVTPAVIAQRIVRAKATIRQKRIHYKVPEPDELAACLQVVMHVIYLLFNEGYYASAGELLTRGQLSQEAIRLGRLLADLLPGPETLGLAALMLLQESRREARSTQEGEIVLLEEQDSRLWSSGLIAEGLSYLTRSMATGCVGRYSVQAAIAAEHAKGAVSRQTDWTRIAALYAFLVKYEPSPVLELNHAVALAMASDAEAGLSRINSLLDRGELEHYHLAHAARADMYRRLGLREEARESYGRALMLATQEPEQRLLRRRLAEVAG